MKRSQLAAIVDRANDLQGSDFAERGRLDTITLKMTIDEMDAVLVAFEKVWTSLPTHADLDQVWARARAARLQGDE